MIRGNQQTIAVIFCSLLVDNKDPDIYGFRL